MKLKRLCVHNYKSLRNVEFVPSGLSTLIGANASGKTNFADAIDFLSTIYRSGLEIAVAIKGGYENIAFRQKRRSKAAITFCIEVEFTNVDLPFFMRYHSTRALRGNRGIKGKSVSPRSILFKHEFSFVAVSEGIKADFKITSEKLSIILYKSTQRSLLEETPDFEIIRESGKELQVNYANKNSIMFNRFNYQLEFYKGKEEQLLGPQELTINPQTFPFFREITEKLSGMSVFRFSPDSSRKAGIPTPNPNLSVNGENLPAMVDWLQRKYYKRWESVQDAMRDVVPGLDEINVQYLHTKTLGLFFKEEHITRPWTAEDISDGTIQTLAMFVASVDPRISVLLIEEPENSVHPWIIKILIERLRELSKIKPVIITTHSPVLIDMLLPKEAWIVYKESGETKLSKLNSLDPSIEEDWEKGKFKLSEYLDSGLVPQAIPGGNN